MDREPAPPRQVWQLATEETGGVLVPLPPSQVERFGADSAPEAALKVLLGATDALVDLMLRAVGSASPTGRQAADAALGVTWTGARAGAAVVRTTTRPVAPLARFLVDPPLVPQRLRIRTLAASAATTWQQERAGSRQRLVAARDATVPQVVNAVLPAVDLTAIVLDDVDLEVLATAVIQRLDLTAVVLDQVDLEAVALAVLDQIDLNAVARERMDLPTLAKEVVDAIDLPEIIRESTGSVASETVRTIRMQSIGADDRVQHLVDRVLAWRKDRDTQAPVSNEEEGGDEVDDGAGPEAAKEPAERVAP